MVSVDENFQDMLAGGPSSMRIQAMALKRPTKTGQRMFSHVREVHLLA